MTSGYRIEWSERAVNDFNTVIGYLSDNWGEQEIRKFVRQIDKNIRYIQAHPQTYPSTFYRHELRRCVISKIHTIYYLVEKKVIYIVTIWDNRRSSGELNKILK